MSRFTALSLALIVAGCGWWSDLQQARNRNLQAHHPYALLDGYRGFETLLFDADTDLVWFQYRLPDGMDASRSTAAVAGQIRTRNPCFAVLEESASEARLRCDRPGTQSFAEYVIATVPADRTVLVMYSSIDSEAELRGYPLAVRDFRARVAGH